MRIVEEEYSGEIELLPETNISSSFANEQGQLGLHNPLPSHLAFLHIHPQQYHCGKVLKPVHD